VSPTPIKLNQPRETPGLTTGFQVALLVKLNFSPNDSRADSTRYLAHILRTEMDQSSTSVTAAVTP
jgi:hypothetical protein